MIHCFLVSSDKHEDAKYMHAKYMHAIYACDLYDDDCPKYTRNICCDPADPGPRGNGGHPQHHFPPTNDVTFSSASPFEVPLRSSAQRLLHDQRICGACEENSRSRDMGGAQWEAPRSEPRSSWCTLQHKQH